MYCQTSSSVQLLSGKTRKCSPNCFRPLKRFQSSVAGSWGPTRRTRSGGRRNRSWLAPCPVSPRTSERCVELELLERVEERHCLQAVAALVRPDLLGDAPLVDRVLDRTHDEPRAHPLDERVAELEGLGKVVARIDVEERGTGAWPGRRPSPPVASGWIESLPPENRRAGFLELRRGLAEDEDRFGFEVLEVRNVVRVHFVGPLSLVPVN